MGKYRKLQFYRPQVLLVDHPKVLHDKLRTFLLILNGNKITWQLCSPPHCLEYIWIFPCICIEASPPGALAGFWACDRSPCPSNFLAKSFLNSCSWALQGANWIAVCLIKVAFIQRSKSYFPRTGRGFSGCNPPAADPPQQRSFSFAGWNFFSLESNTEFFWWCWERGMWEHLRIATGRGKRLGSLFHVCWTACYQRQQDRKGIAEEAAILWNFAQGNDYHVQCGSLNQQSSEGPWKALVVVSEANSPMILSLLRGSEPLSSKPWGFPLCWDISILMWKCHCATLLPQGTVTWVKTRWYDRSD